MHGKRHPLVGLVDEAARLNGRFKSLFAEARRSVGLGDSEIMVLNAVVEANAPPSVAQIGRSLGQARQIVQRAANSLREAGLVETLANPDHRRIPLLRATEAGVAIKRAADARADAIADALMPAIGPEDLEAAAGSLKAIRRQLEAHLRER